MTVSNQQTEFPYIGNGVTVTFAYSCQVQKASDLQVYVNGSVVTSGITKNGIGSLSGGSVTFSVPPASGAAVRLERVVVLERTTDYQQNGDFLARVVNPDFDRLWMALQQLVSGFSRALRFPKSDINPVTELPSAANRANKVLAFDPFGNPILYTPQIGSGSDFSAPTGSSLIGFIANFLGAAYRSVLDKLRDHVSIKDFYQLGDVDDTAAAQRATNTGRAVYFPGGTYRITGVTYTGRVCWYGQGDVTILSDDVVVSGQSATGSRIRSIRMENITPPWIIFRDPSNWDAVPAVVQSNGPGYQPTVNDGDVWPTLTTAQQNQDIGPKIVFQGDASDIVVNDITGRFVSVLIFDAVKSTIKNCNYQGGKSFAGSAVFWNINGQAGSGNRLINNTITYPSNSGVIMSRNNDGEYSNNKISYAGESGIKTYQNDIAGVDARCRRMKIDNNDVRFCYYDSIDAATNYPVDGTVDSQHQITNNDLFGSRQVGIFGDGQLCQISGNKIRRHGKDGIRGFYNQSLIHDNMAVDNNKSNTAVGVHHINIEGVGNTISDNKIRTFGNLGSAIYAVGPNYAFGNTCNDGGFYFGNVGSIDSQLFGNSDAVATMATTIPQRIRQNANNVPALELYTDVSAVPMARMEFHPRHGEVRNPCGGVEGYLSVAADNAEYGGMLLYGASNGILYRGMYIGSNPSVPGKVFPVLNLSNVAITPAMIDTSSLVFWVDEAGNSLKLSVKYADGTTTKTASIALT